MKRLLLLLLLLGASSLQADEIWVGLAEGGDPKLIREQFARTDDLKKTLRAAGLDLIENKSRDLKVGETLTLTYKNDSVVTVECLARDATRYRLRLGLADEQGTFVTTDVSLSRNAPLVIMGPPESRQPLLLVQIR